VNVGLFWLDEETVISNPVQKCVIVLALPAYVVPLSAIHGDTSRVSHMQAPPVEF